MRDKEALLDDFKGYLVESGFRPGDELDSEINLAEKFGVSRGAMREVVMHFTYLSVLKRVKNRGTIIKKFTCEKLEELMYFCFQLSGFSFEELKEARLYMEITIIPLIIKRITPLHIDMLRNNIQRMHDVVSSPEEADQLDKAFHVLLFDICGNRTLKIFSNVILLLFRREYRLKFLNPEAAKKSAKDHELLLNAIIADDSAKACDIIRQHILPT